MAWLGEVPEGWTVKRVGYVFEERNEKVSDTDFEPLSVTKDGVVPRLETAAKTDNNDNRKLVRRGDFAINSRSDRMGSSGLSPLDGSVSLIYTVLKVRGEVHDRFTHYAFRSTSFQHEFYRHGKGIVADLWTTNWSAMKNIAFPLPPLPEQRAIASFLDARTAEIDALVARQRRLIALLHEKKSAVIGHAVTRGLDPDAPLKPSGIEWLGDVPEHWTLSRLKFALGRMTSGGTPDTNVESYWCDEGGSPFVAIGDMSKVSVVLRTARRITEEGARSKDLKLLPKGTILFSMYASLGETAELGVEAYTNQAILSLVPGPDLDPYWLQSWISFLKPYLGIDATTNTQVNLNAEKVGNLPVLLPPIEEMQDICAKLAFKLNRLDFMEGGPHRAIELLLERRSALISAAVTGKLRVPH